MLTRLWVKLLGAFALVIVVGVLVTVVLARQGTATQLSHFMMGDQMLRPGDVQDVLANYYRREGSWRNVDAYLDQLVLAASSGGMMGGMMGNMMGVWDSRIRVVDAAGQVVADSDGPPGGQVLPELAARGWPIKVDGRQVGILLIDGAMMTMSEGQSASLLAGMTRAVLTAGLVAGLVALVLAALLVRQITRPLSALSQASRRIAGGDLAVRVPMHGEDELGELAAAFNQMAVALQEQEVLRQRLMADIAHELRTPLAAIQGTVEAIEDGVFPLTPESLAPVREQTLMLARLVEDLRTLAHAEAGQLSLERRPVDLAELAEQQVASLAPLAQQKGVGLALDVVEAGAPWVEGDAQRLGQVLGNLIRNGVAHTPAGGSVSVRVETLGEHVRVTVADTGEGIASEDLPRVFDRFYRGDRARSRETGGSGLGLAIAKQLVEAHGGRIHVESEPGQGAVFTVLLPRA